MNTNIYTNKWRNLSTNRLLPTVLLLSLSSVSILNYARLQQCQMFANLHYTKTTTVKNVRYCYNILKLQQSSVRYLNCLTYALQHTVTQLNCSLIYGNSLNVRLN